jgi:hypothetical protein
MKAPLLAAGATDDPPSLEPERVAVLDEMYAAMLPPPGAGAA